MARKWNKVPSVRRPGRYFYVSGPVAILQCWQSDTWYISANGQGKDGRFSTPREAMTAADIIKS